MKKGKVCWFRGSFGFITPDGGGPDIFVHFHGIAGPKSQHKVLVSGERVEYDVDHRIEDNKPIAVNVRRVEE